MAGRAVRLNGQPTTILGVMPPGFKIIFPEGSSVPPELDAFVPFRSSLASDPPDQSYLRVIGRLRDGATIPLAQQEIEMIAAHLRSKFTTFAEPPLNLQVVPLQGRPGSKHPSGASGALRRSGVGVADCLHQRGESPALAGQ